MTSCSATTPRIKKTLDFRNQCATSFGTSDRSALSLEIEGTWAVNILGDPGPHLRDLQQRRVMERIQTCPGDS